MKNIIEELWNGERGPQDTLVDNNPHYKELQAGSLQQTFTLHISHNSPDTIVLPLFQSNNDIPR